MATNFKRNFIPIAATKQVGLTQALAVMKRLSFVIATIAVALLGCATSRASDYIYFPDLAGQVLSGDAQAFRQVLVQAETTSPGEQLEELAVISNKFVLVNPTEFLRVQSAKQHCFGVDYMGPDFTDNEPARTRERDLRRLALRSVPDSSLSSIKARCLAALDGS